MQGVPHLHLCPDTACRTKCIPFGEEASGCPGSWAGDLAATWRFQQVLCSVKSGCEVSHPRPTTSNTWNLSLGSGWGAVPGRGNAASWYPQRYRLQKFRARDSCSRMQVQADRSPAGASEQSGCWILSVHAIVLTRHMQREGGKCRPHVLSI